MLSKLTHKELIKCVRANCIPPLLSKFHKGQSGGRVCIIGGCEDYTGAPFFSANATALMGCDLTHVICEKNAATIIKSYSPNLMVHPYLRDMGSSEESEFDKIKLLLNRIHAVVIGPGLGRDRKMLHSVKVIIKFILEEHNGMIPIVLDADALYLINQDKEIKDVIRRFPNGRIILTPNVVEFKRLFDSIFKDGKDKNGNDDEEIARGLAVSRNLKCIVVEKGIKDIIYSPTTTLTNEHPGSNKRVGGQGDTLTGTIACMLAYSRLMYDFDIMERNDKEKKESLQWEDYSLLSCYAGSTITRECSRLAFKAKGRAMQTTDLNERVGEVYANILE